VGIDYAWKPTAHKGNLPLEDFELTQNIVTTFSQAKTTDMHNVGQTDSLYHHLEFPFLLVQGTANCNVDFTN
jgi:hypothetical protein